MTTVQQGNSTHKPSKGGSTNRIIEGGSGFKTQSSNDFNRDKEDHSPILGLILTIAGIAMAEVIAMAIVYNFLELPYTLLILIETAILIVIIIPFLYVFSLRPLLVQIQMRKQSIRIIQARLQLMQYVNTHTLSELLEFSLDEIENLTGSTISFFHFVDEVQKTVQLQSWSTNTVQNQCKVQGNSSHYSLEEAGVWAEAVWQRKPVVHNDYSKLANRKGQPAGHIQVIRELVVPILRNNKVVAILGVGNKMRNYTDSDIEVTSTYADFVWDVVEHKQAEMMIHKSEEKFRTLVEWTYDWELWVDPDGTIIYISPSCERISGYTAAEFLNDPRLLFQIVHPDDRRAFEEHQKVTHEPSGLPITIEYRILTRDQKLRWIEHICRPLFDSNGQHLGRRISNRDVTERKQIEQQIAEQTQKELVLNQTIRSLQTDIGRDLHDTLGNQISFLRMNLEHLSEIQWSDPDIIKSQIQKMTGAANESYEMIRAMLAILQAENLEDPMGLFSHYAEKIAERSSFQCKITSHGIPAKLSLYQIRQSFYIFREALGNIEKYARANNVSISFNWETHGLKLVISDDGIAFDLASAQTNGHYGLKFMRERAGLMKGSLDIQSIAGQGTTVTVEIPYENEQTEQVETEPGFVESSS